MRIIEVGKEAPDFVLKDQHGENVNLNEYRSKRVILSFHPLAWTGVCARQMQALEENRAVFSERNAEAFGVSVDSVPCKEAWAKELRIRGTKLLSDFWPHGEVAESYGIFRAKDGFSERAVIILDEQGVVRFAKVYPMREVPNMEEVLSSLEVIGS
ncbi:peroxiredoxin [Candidatus Bipolaricaulota bacterium]|nr:peroxiredoxin [Candidatus Bipolaricaulota bacterium]